MAKKILLPRGCSMSNPSVNPKDWKSGGRKLMEKNWYISYRFYDPKFPKPKQVFIKLMNEYKTLRDRRISTKALIEGEIKDNKIGYNPFYGRIILSDSDTLELIKSDMDFISAFRMAHEKVKASESHKKQILWCLSNVEKVAKKMNISHMQIKDFTRMYVKSILDYMDLTPSVYNKYRQYLSRLFGELIQLEVIETNPCNLIKKKVEEKRIKRLLTEKEFMEIKSHTSKNCPEFYRFIMIYFYSGTRVKELLRIKKEDVDLNKREYTVGILKGSQKKYVIKPIIHDAVVFWKEAMSLCKSEEYVFGHGLVGSMEKIKGGAITDRWRRQVKIKLGINCKFHNLRHLFFDTLPEDQANKIANHTNVRTTRIYRVNQDKRDLEALKKIRFEKKKALGYLDFDEMINWN